MARQGIKARQGTQGKARWQGRKDARQGIKACHQGMPSRQDGKARWQGKMARQGKERKDARDAAGRQDAAKWRSIVIQIFKSV